MIRRYKREDSVPRYAKLGRQLGYEEATTYVKVKDRDLSCLFLPLLVPSIAKMSIRWNQMGKEKSDKH